MPAITDDETMRGWGSRYARLMMERCAGNKREACRRLNISYHTLNAYLRYQAPRRLVSRGAARALTAGVNGAVVADGVADAVASRPDS
jgi:hypothetical protein